MVRKCVMKFFHIIRSVRRFIKLVHLLLLVCVDVRMKCDVGWNQKGVFDFAGIQCCLPVCVLVFLGLCYVTLRYVTLRFATLRFASLPCASLCYITRRYVTLRYVFFVVNSILLVVRSGGSLHDPAFGDDQVCRRGYTDLGECFLFQFLNDL